MCTAEHTQGSEAAEGFGSPLFLSARKLNHQIEVAQNKMSEKSWSEVSAPPFSTELWKALKFFSFSLFSPF